MHFSGENLEKLIFQLPLKQESLYLLNTANLIKKNTINKYLRSRLTFDISAKISHVGLPSLYLNIFHRSHKAN